jgi:uncharacterized protein (DUF885 family)
MRLRPLFALALLASACAPKAPAAVAPASAQAPVSGDEAFRALERRYAVEFLRRNPSESTYLGGSGLDASLAEADGRLRDFSAAALEAEGRWLEELQRAFEGATDLSSPALRIDREVALAQLRFLLHQQRHRRYQQRSLDTYTDEPFRAVDASLQGLTRTGAKTAGTPEEWRRLAARLRAVGPYLETARAQLEAGVAAGNTPDRRMLARNGLRTSEANAKYFREDFPALAAERIAPGPEREGLLTEVRTASHAAADAFTRFRGQLAALFFEDPSKAEAGVKPAFAKDAYALGEAEYDRALKYNLRRDITAARLYEESWPVVKATQARMVALAREIGKKRGLALPADDHAAVRAVFEALGEEAPKSDAEQLEGYRRAAVRLVEYARRTGLFEVPADYRLEVVETPEPLRASISGAAYYPAPPFQPNGVGRFYVTPSEGDAAALKASNVHTLANLAVHEGFPGHDWYYKMLTRYREDIGPVRWLMPGAVEDSSSMWADSMAMEGWALYAEALMAEPQPGAPEGFFTPEERLYQLGGQLYRELRVPVDIGLHTGRLTYDEAVDLFSQVPGFLPPGSCRDAKAQQDAAKRSSCQSAERAVFRYSKWPTQAITYRLGKDDVLALRQEARERLGKAFDLQRFHIEFMRQGTIPSAYFRDELLRVLQAGR